MVASTSTLLHDKPVTSLPSMMAAPTCEGGGVPEPWVWHQPTSSSLSPLDSWSSSASLPTDSWVPEEDAGGFLDLDFAEESADGGDPLMVAPPFENTLPSLEEEPHMNVMPFVQDQREAQALSSSFENAMGIDPHMLVSVDTPGAPAPTTSVSRSSEPDPAPASDPVPAPVPAPASDLAPVSPTKTEAPEVAVPGATFTAFTPMRLDMDERDGVLEAGSGPSTASLKPLSMLAATTRGAAMDGDELRPSLEEYNKLSSKEKRQLRNKISARNFRNRRKEYIHLLEEQIAERDSLIQSL